MLLVVLVGVAAKAPESVLPIGSDTGMYATYARLMLQGARPYVDFYDVHPPLTYYYWVLVETVAGTDWSRICVGSLGGYLPQPCVGLAAHSLDLALTLVAAGLAYGIARQLGLRRLVGLLAALMLVWFVNESMISTEGSNPTKLTVLPTTLAVYAYLRAIDRGKIAWAVVSGAAGMLAGLAKQPGLLTLIALLGYTVVRVLHGVPTARRVCIGLALGAVLAVLPVLVYLAWMGSLFAFLDEAVRYNVERLFVGYWQSPAGLASPATRLDRVATQAAGLLFVGALIGLFALSFGKSDSRQRVLLVWSAASLVAIVGFREFSQVVPALAVLAALGIGRLWEAASRDGLGLGRPVAGHLTLLVTFASIFVFTTSFQLIEMRRALYERGPGGKPADPEQIATSLRQDAPSGPIFAWANAGQIYALSGRRPASRFLIAEFTDAIEPRAVLSRAQVVSDLEQNPPAVIVVDPYGAQEPGLDLPHFSALMHLIDMCYTRLEGTPSNWRVYIASNAEMSSCIVRSVTTQATPELRSSARMRRI